MPKQSVLQNKEKFRQAACDSKSMSEMLEFLGLRAAGGNYKQLHKYSKLYDIPLPQISGIERTKEARSKKLRKFEDIFCKDSDVARTTLKRAFEKERPRVCEICEIETWLSKPLVVQIDHINGVHNDNRLENLRWLCPNCHSQTETYCTKSLAG